GDVQQHAAADDAVPRVLDRQLAGPLRRDRPWPDAVIQGAVIVDMAQRVDVTVHVTVHVHHELVRGEGHPGHVRRFAGQAFHVPRAGLRIIRCAAGHRGGEGDRPAEPDLARGGGDALRGEVAERAAAVAGPPRHLAAEPVVQGTETGGRHRGTAHRPEASTAWFTPRSPGRHKWRRQPLWCPIAHPHMTWMRKRRRPGMGRPLSGAGNLRAGSAGHAVVFYRDAEEFAGRVSAYLLEALRGGGAAVVIATPGHRRAIRDRLARAGTDVAAAED